MLYFRVHSDCLDWRDNFFLQVYFKVIPFIYATFYVVASRHKLRKWWYIKANCVLLKNYINCMEIYNNFQQIVQKIVENGSLGRIWGVSLQYCFIYSIKSLKSHFSVVFLVHNQDCYFFNALITLNHGLIIIKIQGD